MNWARAGQVTTVAVAVIAIAMIVAARVKDWKREPVTVEREQDDSRAVIGWIGQHHPSEPEEYELIDDPVYMLVHEISLQNQALM